MSNLVVSFALVFMTFASYCHSLPVWGPTTWKDCVKPMYDEIYPYEDCSWVQGYRWQYDYHAGKCTRVNLRCAPEVRNMFSSQTECSNTCDVHIRSHRFRSQLNNRRRRPSFPERILDHKRRDRSDCYQPTYLSLPVKDCGVYYPMWQFNKDVRTCERVTWGGCSRVRNMFSSRAECLDTCVIERKYQ